VSEDAGIEPRNVATTALAVRRSNHSAKSHPLRLNLIRLNLIHKRDLLKDEINNAACLVSHLMVADPDSMGPNYSDLTSVFRQKQHLATKMKKESSCFEEQDVFT
jgi:hypothetical protein